MAPTFAGTGCLPLAEATSIGPDRKWSESNRLVSAWIAEERPRLAEASSLARSIRHRLKSIFPLVSEICRGTCPWCPEPCCIVTRVWFDFRDVLFFHLAGVPLPPGPLHAGTKEPCRYLTFRGCTLPRIQRPWGCTQYLCGTQRRYLIKTSGIMALTDLEAALREIAASRMALEESVAKAAGG